MKFSAFLLLLSFLLFENLIADPIDSLLIEFCETKIESTYFNQTELLIKEYYGEKDFENNLFGAVIKLEGVRIYNPLTNADTVKGIRLVTKKTIQEQLSFIDYEEIDLMLQALTYMTKFGRELAQIEHNQIQIDYKTKDKVKFGLFTNDDGDLKFFLSTIDKSYVLHNFVAGRLTDFKKLITNIKKALDQ